MPRFTEAQLARKQRRRSFRVGTDPAEQAEPQAVERPADPVDADHSGEPLPAFDAVEVPPKAQSTAKAILAWMDDAGSDDEHLVRAEAVRRVNDARPKPWATVRQATDGILG